MPKNRKRTTKTAYEVACLAEANRRAALGHESVRRAFAEGGHSELELHLLYLKTTNQDDPETPYKSIVATGRVTTERTVEVPMTTIDAFMDEHEIAGKDGGAFHAVAPDPKQESRSGRHHECGDRYLLISVLFTYDGVASNHTSDERKMYHAVATSVADPKASATSTMTVSIFGVHSEAMASRVNGISDGVRIADCAYWMSRLSTDGRLPTVPAIAVYTWFSTHRA